VPLYRAPEGDVQPGPAAAQASAGVACRCCLGGISRSTRARRYPSDMTEAEWAVCEPLLPAPAWLAGRGGRPARSCMRDIVDAIRYLTHNGPVWRALPGDFPPAGTVYWWADKWQAGGCTERMHDDLRDWVRAAAGRTTAPTAAIIDSQSVKGSEMIGGARRGYDAGKKINGTKRHLAVDVLGLLLTVLVTAASVQDRDAARPLLWNLRRAFPSIKLAWADGGYAGKLVTWAKTRLRLTLQIVRRPDDLHTFQVLPRRWVVERTLSWITRHRRTVRDYERLPAHHETYVYWAMIIVMTRHLARKPRPASTPVPALPQAT
jgi:transposase